MDPKLYLGPLPGDASPVLLAEIRLDIEWALNVPQIPRTTATVSPPAISPSQSTLHRGSRPILR